MLSYDTIGDVTLAADGELAFSYDGRERLVTASTGLGGTAGSSPESCAYDAEGNRTASHLVRCPRHRNRLPADRRRFFLLRLRRERESQDQDRQGDADDDGLQR